MMVPFNVQYSHAIPSALRFAFAVHQIIARGGVVLFGSDYDHLAHIDRQSHRGRMDL